MSAQRRPKDGSAWRLAELAVADELGAKAVRLRAMATQLRRNSRMLSSPQMRADAGARAADAVSMAQTCEACERQLRACAEAGGSP